jgi:hypothetical protein
VASQPVSTAESVETSHMSSEKSVEGTASEKTSPGEKVVIDKSIEVREKCKERLQQYRKTMTKSMILSDQLDMRDPQSIAEYAQEIYRSMRDLEPYYKIDHNYLTNVQKEIKDTSRAFLVEWIIDVTRKFRLLPETLYVTVSIIDRFLSLVNIKKS